MYLSDLDKGINLIHNINPKRGIYLHVIDGQLSVNQTIINTGDAIEAADESSINIIAQKPSRIILFDVTLDF